MEYTEKIIGIDLGTTNSVVAVLEGEEPIVIPNAEGDVKTPSIVHFDKDGKVLVGETARRMLATDPHRTVFSTKRLIGHYFSEMEEAVANLPYEVLPDDDDGLLIRIDDKHVYQPRQISAMVLEKLKRDAEDYLGEKVTQAIITVPANFDDLQRQATKEAGRLAGLEVLRLVNEPTAAAMAYGLGKGNDGVVAVYDFGGGTFDVTLMEISGRTFEVIVCEGDSYLGGDDLDDLLVQLVIDDVFEQHGHDMTRDTGALARVKEAAEKAKCELSSVRQATIALPFLAQIDGQPLNYERVITRGEFEDLAEPMVQRTIDCCEKALKAARMGPEQIDKVILVGGSTRVPMVQELVEDFFGMPPHRGVNPDEVVALGAATQAGVLAGALEEVVLLDVTPRSLGLETRDDSFSKIIEKNSTIPIKMAKTFTTTEENQEMVNIHVLQGEEAQASQNLSLGKFLLKGVQPAAAGVPRIRVTFQINADGILDIGAQDMATGNENQLLITHTFLSAEERKQKAAKKKQAVAGGGRRRGRNRRGAPAAMETGVKPQRFGVRSPSDTGNESSTGGGRQRDSSTGGRSAPASAAGGATSDFAMLSETNIQSQELPSSAKKGGMAEVSSNGGASAQPVAASARPSPALPAAGPEETSDLPAETPADRDTGSGTGSRSRVKPEDLLESGVDFGRTPLSASRPPTVEVAAPAPPPMEEPDEFEALSEPEPAAQAPRAEAPRTSASRLSAASAAPRPPIPKPEPPLGPRAPVAKPISRESPIAPASSDSLWSPSDLVEELRRDTTQALKASSAAEAERTQEAIEKKCPPERITEAMDLAFTLLEADRADDNAVSCYETALPDIDKLLLEFPLDSTLLRHCVMIWLSKNDAEKALDYYKRYRKSPGANLRESSRLLSKMVDRNPNMLDARNERAKVYEEQAKFEGAIKDYEFIINRQSSNETTLKRLEAAYKKLLDSRYSPSTELKFIKVLLRRNKLDEAIKRLQNIVEDPQFRTRAQKVLGFCYWQKQMYYPAFLQFKNLALDDEIKDTIYRLANDMETKGDHQRALEAFEFLNDRLPGFRDVKEHIDRVRPLASRQAGGSGGTGSGGAGGGRAPGGYDALKGSRFIILEELNRGSMGIVYKAKDQTLNEIVALKVLNDYLCTDPLAIERFKREARAAKKLSHQYIIRIHDLFEMNDKTFLSMEFIDGDDIKKMLQERKKVPSKEVAVVGAQICDALEYAHKRGVVHRDIKPANIIVESLDPVEIKVADFGIAKQLNADDMTTGSRIMGTPLYMAPEQIEGRQVDARSDIYALGIMMYEMVTGMPPFCEGNIEYQHINKEPPGLPPTVDAVLAKIILKCIAKRKEGRYQSAGQLKKALDMVIEDKKEE